MKALVTCAAVICFSAFAFGADSDVEQQITSRSKAFTAAWDKHDAKAIAEFYAEGAEMVIAKGETFSTRDGIEQALSDGFNGDLKDTTLTESIEKVRLIKPDVAIVDSEVQIK